MRFIHQILSNPARVLIPWGQVDSRQTMLDLQEHVESQKACLSVSHSLIADNVATYYCENKKLDWDLEKFPAFTPPWNPCFIEWANPKRWLMPGGWEEPETGGWKLGMLVSTFDRGSEAFSLYAPQLRFFRGSVDSAHRLLAFAEWRQRSPKEGATPVFLAVTHFLTVDSEGACTGYGITAPPAIRQALIDNAPSSLHIACLSLSFCHCRNVVLDEVTHTEAPKPRIVRQNKLPGTRFYTLRIGEIGERSSARGSGGSDGARALHICRGNFAHYSADRPLFGRIVGTVWRPMHVRGEESSGTVLKQYDVAAVESVSDGH